MGLEWFEYYTLMNSISNLKEELAGMRKELDILKKEIKMLKAKKEEKNL